MSTTSATTAEQLLNLTADGNRYELVAGELRMMSPGSWKHGKIVMRIGRLIANYVESHQLGEVFAAETGFLISRNPDTVLAADVSFVATKNIPAELPERGYWPNAPDLAVEVLSPHDSLKDAEEKMDQWIDAGCRLGWLMNPRTRTVQVFAPQTEATVHPAEDEIDGGNVLPGFRCRVVEMFDAD